MKIIFKENVFFEVVAEVIMDNMPSKGDVITIDGKYYSIDHSKYTIVNGIIQERIVMLKDSKIN